MSETDKFGGGVPDISTFRVEFTEKALGHLESFRRFERNIILDAIKAQLPHQPLGYPLKAGQLGVGHVR